MKRSLLFGGLAVGGAVGVLAACQAIDGIHVYEYTPEASIIVVPGEAGGPNDGSVIIVKADAATCDRATEPQRPTSDSDGFSDTTTNEYVLAMTYFSFTGNGAATVGYDLDFVCTGEQGTSGPPGPSSCLPPQGAMIQDDITSSAGAGVDAVLSNASGALSQIFRGTLDDVADTTSNIIDGTQTLLLVIDDYNGRLNDPQVSVTAYTSQWVQAIGCGAPDLEAGPNDSDHYKPQTDGCDVWSTSTPEAGTPSPFYSTGDAWVNNGTLVADFLVGIPINIGNVAFTPVSPHIVANLTFLDGGVDGGPRNPALGNTPLLQVTGGLLQGTLGSGSFLRTLGNIQDPTADDAGICPGGILYNTLYPALCKSLDINQSGDFSGTQNCDGFTFAAAFNAITAQRGTAVYKPPAAYRCPGGNPDAAGVVDCPLALP